MSFLRLRAACLLFVALLAAALAPLAAGFLLPSPSGSSSRAAAGRIVERRWQQQQQQLDSRLAAPVSASSTALWAKKNKESDVIEVDGIVKESLPNAKFRVELVATKAVIVCSTSGKMRKNFVRVLVGDPVKVELSPYDLTRGRITYRSRGGKGGDSSPPPPPPPSS